MVKETAKHVMKTIFMLYKILNGIKPENNENIKYKVPISLAFDDKNHLSCHSVGCLNVKPNPLFSLLFKVSCFTEVE